MAKFIVGGVILAAAVGGFLFYRSIQKQFDEETYE